MPSRLNFLTRIPVAFFGMPLGIIALGIAWRNALDIWPLPASIASTLIWFGAVLWLLLFLIYVAKWIWQRASAQTEFGHPVQCCFVGLAGVVASLSSIGLAAQAPKIAFPLFVLGGAWTLLFAMYRTGHLWTGGRKPEETTPVLYLPTVAGGFVTASAASTFGLPELGQLAFGAALFGWLAIESIVIHRLYTAASMPLALRPTLGIQLAPPAVAAVAYLNVGAGVPDLFAHALLGYAILQALILVRMSPWLSAAGLTPAWWGFSFGAAALPTAAIKLVAHGESGLIASLAIPLFVAGNAVIGALMMMTLYLLIAGRLLSPAPAAAVPPSS